ncbi:MAG: NAD(P)/FAD-dependent oxidoreductase [Candidatus Helarchaeota archaeon]|nr:NAD(P)/FAD-dependent oxidoreductase [Candidatus Helarchaeota archaeon]
MTQFDVIIVGAGPGGSLAGKTAAELGLKTLILERGSYPGAKNASGCALSPKLWRDFRDIMKGLNVPSMRTVRIHTSHLVDEDLHEEFAFSQTPSKRLNTYKEAKEFFTVNLYRSEFDPWLAKIAVAAGAELQNSTTVADLSRNEKGKVDGVITDTGERIKGRIIIGADGAWSIVARRAGIRAKWQKDEVTLVISYDFKCESKQIVDDVIGDNGIHTWLGGGFPGAYQFFKADGFHLGLGDWLSSWDKNPRAHLNTALKVDGIRKLIRLTKAKIREFHAHLLPWLKYPGKTYTDNVLLIGDAAGFPCPLEAEGIWYAMYSGRIAAQIAKKALDAGDTSKAFLKEYEEAWKDSEIGVEFEAGPELQEFWANLPFAPKNMAWFSKLLNDQFAIFTTGEAHITYLRRFNELLVEQADVITPFLTRYILPIFGKVLKQPLGDLKKVQQLMKQMTKSKKKR